MNVSQKLFNFHEEYLSSDLIEAGDVANILHVMWVELEPFRISIYKHHPIPRGTWAFLSSEEFWFEGCTLRGRR